jgi:hypothetical protein
LDAVAAVLLDGLSYRRAGRALAISKTEVGDSLDLLLGALGDVGFCQPDGSFITSLDDLRHWLGEMAKPVRRSASMGRPPGSSDPARGPTRRSCATPSDTATPPRAWPSRPSTATCCGATAAGQAAATSTSCWHWQGWDHTLDDVEVAQPAGSRVPRVWPRRASTGRRRSGTAAPRTPSTTPSGPTTICRRDARAGGAVDLGQRVGAAPLALAALPRPGRLPGRWCAGLPWPVAPPDPHKTKHQRTTSVRPKGEPRCSSRIP